MPNPAAMLQAFQGLMQDPVAMKAMMQGAQQMGVNPQMLQQLMAGGAGGPQMPQAPMEGGGQPMPPEAEVSGEGGMPPAEGEPSPEEMAQGEIDGAGYTWDGVDAPTQNDIDRLMADPSPEAVASFNEQFGEGAAEQYLGGGEGEEPSEEPGPAEPPSESEEY